MVSQEAEVTEVVVEDLVLEVEDEEVREACLHTETLYLWRED